ncbi:MAG: hypothetical protein OXU20_26695 [Myxococcales bacterium]|nr:hypothetical protein [Myxococcales bacterium]MDD9971380.1 hypothetical protein [Myxococcales bacterium]
MRPLASWLASVSLALLACGSEGDRATPSQCRAIFDRLVAIELREIGFVDDALTARRQRELAARYRNDIAACAGKSIKTDAMRCVRSAQSAEYLSHVCLE